MKKRLWVFVFCLPLIVAALLTFQERSSAQSSSVRRHITEAIDETRLTTLRGNTHPLARPEFDRGDACSAVYRKRPVMTSRKLFRNGSFNFI
jgi:hypothetical protein